MRRFDLVIVLSIISSGGSSASAAPINSFVTVDGQQEMELVAIAEKACPDFFRSTKHSDWLVVSEGDHWKVLLKYNDTFEIHISRRGLKSICYLNVHL